MVFAFCWVSARAESIYNYYTRSTQPAIFRNFYSAINWIELLLESGRLNLYTIYTDYGICVVS